MTASGYWRRSVVLTAALGLVLAACSDQDGDDAPSENVPELVESVEVRNDHPPEDPDCKGNKPPKVKGNGELVIGTLLPETGALSAHGTEMFAAADLAVAEINDAGGVLGSEVRVFHWDSADADPVEAAAEQALTASQAVDAHLIDDVDVIVGPPSAGVTETVIDKVTDAGILQISPTNASERFSTWCDRGLYFRTAPPVALQGAALADLIAEDGAESVVILAPEDGQGAELAGHVAAGLGDAVVADTISYSANPGDFADIATEAADHEPDAIVLTGFEETVDLVGALVAVDAGPPAVRLYLTEGGLADYSDDLAAGTLDEHVKGVRPSAEPREDFVARLTEVDGDLSEFSYAAETYDAVVLAALAALAADSDAGPDIAAELVGITTGGQGCADFVNCKDLLDGGEAIEYVGATGRFEFFDNGDRSVGSFGVYEYR